MAVKQRIIAKLLIEDGLCVKYRQFTRDRRIVGNPLSVMTTLTDQKLDEFHICFTGVVDTALVREIALNAFTPVSVSGSIVGENMVDRLIRECAADRVVTKDHETGRYIAQQYGVQAAIYPITYSGEFLTVSAPDWAGEILLTSIDRDGMMHGMDIGVLGRVRELPVTIAGGCGKLSHAGDAFRAGAGGVAIASMFAFSSRSPIQLRSYLQTQGANVRVA